MTQGSSSGLRRCSAAWASRPLAASCCAPAWSGRAGRDGREDRAGAIERQVPRGCWGLARVGVVT
eukprot:10714802-Alexandrium_andersonii.AAC.1